MHKYNGLIVGLGALCSMTVVGVVFGLPLIVIGYGNEICYLLENKKE